MTAERCSSNVLIFIIQDVTNNLGDKLKETNEYVEKNYIADFQLRNLKSNMNSHEHIIRIYSSSNIGTFEKFSLKYSILKKNESHSKNVQ